MAGFCPMHLRCLLLYVTGVTLTRSTKHQMRVTRQRKTTTTLSLVVRGGSLAVTYRAFPSLSIRTSQSRETDGGWASRDSVEDDRG